MVGRAWTIAEAEKARGLKPGEFGNLALPERYAVLAHYRAGVTMQAWESLPGRERSRLMWMLQHGGKEE